MKISVLVKARIVGSTRGTIWFTENSATTGALASEIEG